MVVASVVLLIANVVIVAVVLLCASGHIPVNPVAGIRSRTVRASEAAWCAGHKAARPATVTGCLLAAALLAASLFPVGAEVESALVLAAVIMMVVSLVVGAVFANRAATAVLDRNNLPTP
jgi:hypothetical protein